MHTPLPANGTHSAQQRGLNACLCVAMFAALIATGKAQAQSNLANSNINPNAEFSRPEITALSGVVPTAPVRLSIWGFEVYDARLWTPLGFRHSQHVQHPFALEIQYLRRLEGATLASRALEQMRRLGSFSDVQAQNWLSAMNTLFPNVSQGDRITSINLPGLGAEFWVNGQRVGTVKDPAFARLFFGVWLDERTSEPKMRAQLLQGLQP